MKLGIDILIVFGLLVVAIYLFATEKISFDVTALIIMSTLMVTKILTPEEGLSGFSNEATITIAAMFVISEGIRKSGFLEIISNFFSTMGKKRNSWLALFIMMLVISVISGFINNTAAVAIFIPVIIAVASDLKINASKLLMPLSFASMFGGVCTLLGTSTNILVSSIAEERGVPGFSMFEFLPLGLILLVVGFVYLFLVGIRLIPERRAGKDLTEDFKMHEYLTDVVVNPQFKNLGKKLDEETLIKDLDLDIIEIFKKKGVPDAKKEENVLEAGDIIRIRGKASEIRKLLDREDLSLRLNRRWDDLNMEEQNIVLIEAVIAPHSFLESKPVGAIDLVERFNAVLLAIRHHGELQQESLQEAELYGGDSILLCVQEDRVRDIHKDPAFVVASRVPVEKFKRKKMPIALGILAGVVLTAAIGFLPIVISAVIGTILLILTGCITTEEAYKAVNWKIIFLLAGVLPLGIAMDKTGAAELISDLIVNNFQRFGNTAVLSGFFFLSMMLTNVVSNQATAALLAPVVIRVSQTLDASSRPFLMAITFAASLCFMSPIGYQTNTLIYGPGNYKFTDFTKVGAPLNLIFWILATFLIPIIWPF